MHIRRNLPVRGITPVTVNPGSYDSCFAVATKLQMSVRFQQSSGRTERIISAPFGRVFGIVVEVIARRDGVQRPLCVQSLRRCDRDGCCGSHFRARTACPCPPPAECETRARCGWQWSVSGSVRHDCARRDRGGAALPIERHRQ